MRFLAEIKTTQKTEIIQGKNWNRLIWAYTVFFRSVPECENVRRVYGRCASGEEKAMVIKILYKIFLRRGNEIGD